MSIKFNKVMIHGKNVTDRVKSISESDYGYRVCFSGGACTFNKSDVNIFTCDIFDITNHEFSDWEISSADFEYGEFTIRFFEVNAIHLNKDDAIAIAKALGVTGEDLK